MASGLALVSTGVGGASEVFEERNQRLAYQAGDSYAISKSIRTARTQILLYFIDFKQPEKNE